MRQQPRVRSTGFMSWAMALRCFILTIRREPACRPARQDYRPDGHSMRQRLKVRRSFLLCLQPILQAGRWLFTGSTLAPIGATPSQSISCTRYDLASSVRGTGFGALKMRSSDRSSFTRSFWMTDSRKQSLPAVMSLAFLTRVWALAIAGLVATGLISQPAYAEQVSGRVLVTQGHIAPECRMVLVRRADTGSEMWFRIPANNSDILAVTMTALASRLTVQIAYSPGVTTGCGTEPRIEWISLISDAP